MKHMNIKQLFVHMVKRIITQYANFHYYLADENILIEISSPNVQYILSIVYVETINWITSSEVQR
jgi:hypothetical protein